MATVKIVKPNNTPEQNQKVLDNIARTMEKILFKEHGHVEVKLYYSSDKTKK